MSVLAGAQAPEVLRLNVENAEAASEPLDLTTVSAVSLSVTQPDGRRVTWAAEIESATEDLLVLEHEFAAVDVEQPGNYAIVILLTVPGGVRRAGPTSLPVVA